LPAAVPANPRHPTKSPQRRTFWVDPKEQLVAVLMVQSSGVLRAYHRTLFRQLVYQVIVD
jgi:hypothetical protein